MPTDDNTHTYPDLEDDWDICPNCGGYSEDCFCEDDDMLEDMLDV